MHHVHESPDTSCLCRSIVLALGAVLAGMVFRRATSLVKRYGEFWKSALFTLPDNHVLEEMAACSCWRAAVSPFVAMAIGFVLAWYMYIRKSPETPRIAGAAASRALPVPA